MAIQPIDLQAIFSQIDKVGKNQAVMREGQQIQEALQQVQIQRKLEQEVHSVNEAPNMGEEAKTIKDENRRGQRSQHEEFKGKQDEEDGQVQDDERQDMIRDPALGRNIDISG